VVAAAAPTPPPGAPPPAAEGEPVQAPPAPVPAKTAAEPPSTRSALRAMPALLERPAAAPQLAKVSVKAVAKPNPARRAKSLDDLISQIMASR
jgi:hypothetical protein